MSRIRLGIVGAGSGHARSNHLPGWLHANRFTVAALYDPNVTGEGMAKAKKLCPQAVVCDSLEALLGRTDVDAVIITSLDEFHAAQALAAVQAGKHVLCEKPLGLNEADLALVTEAVELAKARNLVFTTCLPRQVEGSNRPYGWARANMSRLVKEFGLLKQVWLDFSYHTPDAEWKGDRSLLGDHFAHDGLTAYTLACAALGVDTAQMVATTEIDGALEYLVRGRIDDIFFVCSGTRYLSEKVFPETITLRFARGTCTIDTRSGSVAEKWHGTGHVRGSRIDGMASNDDYDDRSRRIMAAFAAAIVGGQGGAAYLSDGELWLTTAMVVKLLTEGAFRSND